MNNNMLFLYEMFEYFKIGNFDVLFGRDIKPEIDSNSLPGLQRVHSICVYELFVNYRHLSGYYLEPNLLQSVFESQVYIICFLCRTSD